MSGGAILLALAGAVLWLHLIAALPFLRARWRSRIKALALASGVPLLGALTWVFGALAGLLALVLGALLLTRPLGRPAAE